MLHFPLDIEEGKAMQTQFN